MMQVKKYRAATTRDALEKIKQELGEDAFVLETKRIQSRGFLGLKTESMIEISAAAAPKTSAKKADSDAKQAKSFSKFSIKEDSFAAPNKTSENLTEKNASNARALYRAEVSKDIEKTSVLQSALPKREFVEISTDAPRIVHPKKEDSKQKEIEKTLAFEQDLPDAKKFEVPAPIIQSRDLELLRAELREVKFTLGAYAAQQNIHFSHGVFDFEAQGEIFDSPFYESFIDLTATGIPTELARKLVQDVIEDYKLGFVEAEDVAQNALLRGLKERVNFGADPLQKNSPSILAIVGATGVGKTTTIAKLAARVALHESRPVELVTLDTYRIAAVDQLKTYAEIIGAGCHVVRSTLELDALLRRLHKEATVLIDTTGRSPHDLADQYELCDYLQRRSEIRKCLAIQATTNALDAVAAVRKFEMYGVDCLAITKIDETTRPGVMLELAAESRLPLVYFGTGQRVPEDLQIAEPQSFAARIFGEKNVRHAFASHKN